MFLPACEFQKNINTAPRGKLYLHLKMAKVVVYIMLQHKLQAINLKSMSEVLFIYYSNRMLVLMVCYCSIVCKSLSP